MFARVDAGSFHDRELSTYGIRSQDREVRSDGGNKSLLKLDAERAVEACPARNGQLAVLRSNLYPVNSDVERPRSILRVAAADRQRSSRAGGISSRENCAGVHNGRQGPLALNEIGRASCRERG